MRGLSVKPIYRSGGDDLPQSGGRLTAALPAAEETVHRSASNGLRRRHRQLLFQQVP